MFHMQIWIFISFFTVLLDYSRGTITIPYLDSEIDCPDVDTPMMINNVNYGIPFRVHRTVPKGLRIAPSNIPDAGLGVIADTFIPKYTWLGDFEGDIIPQSWEKSVGNYAWQMRRSGITVGLVDADNLEVGNYLRFFNMPNRYKDENVVPLYCYTRIFYITTKDIVPGTELLIDYGANYAINILNMDMNHYFDLSEEWRALGMDLNNKTHRGRIYDADLDLNVVTKLRPSDLPEIAIEFEKEKYGVSHEQEKVAPNEKKVVPKEGEKVPSKEKIKVPSD